MLFEDFRQEGQEHKQPKLIEEDQEIDRSLADDIEPEGHLFGLSPGKRLVIAFLLSMMILILGVLFLLVTSKIAPPFLD